MLVEKEISGLFIEGSFYIPLSSVSVSVSHLQMKQPYEPVA